MLRILQVIPTYYPAVRYGGPIRSVHFLSAALARRGHEVHVYATTIDGDGDVDAPHDRPVEIDGVVVHYFPSPALRRLYWSPSMGARLRETAARFDVVHTHSMFLWPTWAAARAATRAGVPYVISPRGMLVAELIRRKSRWVKNAWIQLIDRRLLERAAGVHVTSELEEREARALRLPLPRVFCVPNGVACPVRREALSAGRFARVPVPYALALGRINWKKGLDRLIAAWPFVPDLHLVIAGNDDEGYVRTLQALAREHSVADRVSFVGPASDAEKWELYANAEVFALPSYSENFGNVVIEAMAMGCPVVVTPEVGLADQVQALGAGVVTPGEPETLAAAIRSLHTDVDARREMGRRGRHAAEHQFSWDAVGAQMESAYLRCSSSPPP